MRRSGSISKILLMKRLKSKVYVSFRIRLYYDLRAALVTPQLKNPPHPQPRTTCFFDGQNLQALLY